MDYFQHRDTHDSEKGSLPDLPPDDLQQSTEEARLQAQATAKTFVGRCILTIGALWVLSLYHGRTAPLVTINYAAPNPGDIRQPSYCDQLAVWEKAADFDGQTSEDAPFRAQQPLELPLDASILTLSSWGLPESFSGTLEISQTGLAGSNHISVEAEVVYPAGSPDATHDATALRVCSTTPAAGEWRLNVFSSGWFEPNAKLKLHVRLPPAHCNSPLAMKSLTANLANFDIRLYDLAAGGQFDMVNIVTTNGVINADALAADTIALTTVNKPIRGTFNTTKSLRLTTTNAEIAVRANLHSDAGSDGSPTTVHMHTTNARLDSQVGLYSSAHGKTGGNFLALVRTSNGPLELSFPDHPVDGRLQAAVRTTNKAAAVTLHPAFQGTFAVRTTNASPEVDYDDGVEDPAGSGRKRQFDLEHHTDSYLRGRVGWGDHERDAEGRVTLTTSNAKIKIAL